MKKVAGKLRLEAAQFRELEAFSQIGSDLDKETKAQLERGKRLVEIFKQEQYSPLPVANQVLIFYAVTSGFLDNVPVERINEFEKGLYQYAQNSSNDILKEVTEKKELNDGIEKSMTELINDYKSTLDYLIKGEEKTK